MASPNSKQTVFSNSYPNCSLLLNIKSIIKTNEQIEQNSVAQAYSQSSDHLGTSFFSAITLFQFVFLSNTEPYSLRFFAIHPYENAENSTNAPKMQAGTTMRNVLLGKQAYNPSRSFYKLLRALVLAYSAMLLMRIQSRQQRQKRWVAAQASSPMNDLSLSLTSPIISPIYTTSVLKKVLSSQGSLVFYAFCLAKNQKNRFKFDFFGSQIIVQKSSKMTNAQSEIWLAAIRILAIFQKLSNKHLSAALQIKFLMRLATQYQQQPKKQSIQQDQGRKYIVRLGKGVPQPQKRKRGISLSKQRQKMEVQSLARHEISKQKIIQQLQASRHTQQPKKQGQVVTTKAVYGTNCMSSSKNYAAQHLLLTPQISRPEAVREERRLLVSSKSQQNFFTSSPQKYFGNQLHLQSKIQHFNVPSESYIPVKQLASIGFRRGNESQFRNIPQVSNIRFISPPSHVGHQPKLHNSSPMSTIKFVQFKQPVKQPQSVVQLTTIQTAKKIPINNEMSHLESTKQMANYYRKEDPYSLVSSKRTKKVEEYEQDINNDELMKTKKPLRKLPQCKQVSSSSSLSIESQGNKFQGKGIRSLWDANKAESIISMKESQEIKVEQSEVMIDYFDPKHSFSRKK